ncbi:uncharacterized protein LOC131155598 [Malania oleifera]|uniref:uncharacterized protein LOC131155598 n=1 Tax=Malania oleifera TaxID=397392 RepID=UPI0025AE81D8|nr:uncharacterized protein LOC131155598 [Malania oleifera]
MDDEFPPPVKLVNFVSEEQLNTARKTRGERVEDGTAQRDRPLFEILKENKDKRDAEFNERFKHRPPKALDEDETEFLEKLEMSKREYERQLAADEAQQLRSFQVAVAAQATVVHELKETPPVSEVQEQKLAGRKHPMARPPPGMIIKVKPQAKKAKLDLPSLEEPQPSDRVKTQAVETEKPNGNSNESHDVAKTGLVSYSDESEDDD